jgi:pimeloyl-ACP methyl ester carboxylesterase/ketosteroid isomerase-like protein
MADELHALFHGAGVQPPLILVGHSLGGYNVRIYQSRYPEEVAALVLIESAHPQQWSRLPPEVEQLVRSGPEMLRARADVARQGGLTAEAVAGDIAPTLPGPVRKTLAAALVTAKPYEGQAQEFEAAFESATQVTAGRLGALPLVVLSARNSYRDFEGTGIPVQQANRAWLEMQDELASLSSASTHLFSDGTHALHENDPGAMVSAVMAAVAQVRRVPLSPAALGLPESLLAATSTPEVDALLARLESTYRAKDIEAFVRLFSEDFVQLDVTRRVHVKGRDAWTAWTRELNAAHLSMERRHRGRARLGDWIVVEIEWSGTVRGEAFGTPGGDRRYRYTGLGLLQVEKGVIRGQVLYGDATTLVEQLQGAARPGG